MLKYLRRLFHIYHPLDEENLGEEVRDITFRLMEEEDIATCLSIYQANEAAHFPPGHASLYESKLRSRAFLTLLATRDGKAVGCCSLYHTLSLDGIPLGMLCFGMVDPNYQRMGIGTAQLLVRLALLPESPYRVAATMAAVPNSIPFYKRFGFKFNQQITGDDGNVYAFGILMASETLIHNCRRELALRNITCPDVRDKIPYHKPDSLRKSPPSPTPGSENPS